MWVFSDFRTGPKLAGAGSPALEASAGPVNRPEAGQVSTLRSSAPDPDLVRTASACRGNCRFSFDGHLDFFRPAGRRSSACVVWPWFSLASSRHPPYVSLHGGGVDQLVRSSPCHGEGCGFEPRRSRHFWQENFTSRLVVCPITAIAGRLSLKYRRRSASIIAA
jgi:hypothetical protein